MRKTDFKAYFGTDAGRYGDMTFEEFDDRLTKYQKMAYTRWAKHFGYKSYQGYLTARYNFAWQDYSTLRERSP